MDKASALEFSVRFRKPFRFVDFDTKVLKRSFRKIGQKSPGDGQEERQYQRSFEGG